MFPKILDAKKFPIVAANKAEKFFKFWHRFRFLFKSKSLGLVEGAFYIKSPWIESKNKSISQIQ